MDRDRDAAHLPSNSYIPQDRGLGRPVDRRQEMYEPSPFAAQKVLPHGDVTPDGSRPWPKPSMTSRVLVYGGAAVAAAAVTAGAVLAVRTIADRISGNDDLDRDAERAAEKARARVYDAGRGRYAAPRFAGLTEVERNAMRARARARMSEDDEARSRLRARAGAPNPNNDGAYDQRADQGRTRSDLGGPAMRPRRPRPQPKPKPTNLLGDIEHTAQSLTRNINGIVGAIGSAVAAFRTVAAQAEGVVKEFHGTADQIRGFLGSAGRSASDAAAANRFADHGPARPGADAYRRPRRSDMVDLRDDSGDVQSARTHRL